MQGQSTRQLTKLEAVKAAFANLLLEHETILAQYQEQATKFADQEVPLERTGQQRLHSANSE